MNAFRAGYPVRFGAMLRAFHEVPIGEPSPVPYPTPASGAAPVDQEPHAQQPTPSAAPPALTPPAEPPAQPAQPPTPPAEPPALTPPPLAQPPA